MDFTTQPIFKIPLAHNAIGKRLTKINYLKRWLWNTMHVIIMPPQKQVYNFKYEIKLRSILI